MPRFAVYVVPPAASPLARAANAWLGYDPVTGRALTQPPVPSIPPDRLAAVTAAPRRYGFHGTMKAPFALDPARSLSELMAALDRLCAGQEPFELQLELGSIGGFLALVPASPSPELAALAATCVRDLDPFRAPLTPEDRARRSVEHLSPRECEHLERWGYPHVMDLFRFHMTLTQRLAAPEHDRMRDVLTPLLAPLLARPLRIDRLALLRQPDRDAAFLVLAQSRFRA